MNYNETVTNWVARLGEGDERAIEVMFSKYFERLIRLAVRKMHGLNSVPRSGEDIALSAINSFCVRVKDNKIVLSSENELWGCLFKITTRKACAERRKSFAARRGLNKITVSGNQCNGETEEMIFNSVAGKEPSPELAMELAEHADELLSLFKDTPLRYSIVSLKLQGLTVQEIAEQVNLAPRTIFWNLNQIQSKWIFYKSLEYLVDNLFDCIPFSTLGENLDWSESVVITVVEEIIEMWGNETGDPNEKELLRIRLFKTDKFNDQFDQGVNAVREFKSRLGQIQRNLARLIRSPEWGTKLETLVKNLLQQESKV